MSNICLFSGVFHPLGALLFTNGTYVNTLEIISRTNVTSEVFDDAGNPAWLYNWTTGDVTPAPTPSVDFQSLLAWAQE